MAKTPSKRSTSKKRAPKRFANGGVVSRGSTSPTGGRAAMDAMVKRALSSGNLASARGQAIPSNVMARFRAAQPPAQTASGGRAAMDNMVNQALSSGNLASARGQAIPSDVMARYSAAQPTAQPAPSKTLSQTERRASLGMPFKKGGMVEKKVASKKSIPRKTKGK